MTIKININEIADLISDADDRPAPRGVPESVTPATPARYNPVEDSVVVKRPAAPPTTDRERRVTARYKRAAAAEASRGGAHSRFEINRGDDGSHQLVPEDQLSPRMKEWREQQLKLARERTDAGALRMRAMIEEENEHISRLATEKSLTRLQREIVDYIGENRFRQGAASKGKIREEFGFPEEEWGKIWDEVYNGRSDDVITPLKNIIKYDPSSRNYIFKENPSGGTLEEEIVSRGVALNQIRDSLIDALCDENAACEAKVYKGRTKLHIKTPDDNVTLDFDEVEGTNTNELLQEAFSQLADVGQENNLERNQIYVRTDEDAAELLEDASEDQTAVCVEDPVTKSQRCYVKRIARDPGNTTVIPLGDQSFRGVDALTRVEADARLGSGSITDEDGLNLYCADLPQDMSEMDYVSPLAKIIIEKMRADEDLTPEDRIAILTGQVEGAKQSEMHNAIIKEANECFGDAGLVRKGLSEIDQWVREVGQPLADEMREQGIPVADSNTKGVLSLYAQSRKANLPFPGEQARAGRRRKLSTGGHSYRDRTLQRRLQEDFFKLIRTDAPDDPSVTKIKVFPDGMSARDVPIITVDEFACLEDIRRDGRPRAGCDLSRIEGYVERHVRKQDNYSPVVFPGKVTKMEIRDPEARANTRARTKVVASEGIPIQAYREIKANIHRQLSNIDSDRFAATQLDFTGLDGASPELINQIEGIVREDMFTKQRQMGLPEPLHCYEDDEMGELCYKVGDNIPSTRRVPPGDLITPDDELT